MSSVGDLSIRLGVDMSGVTEEFTKAEQMAAGSAERIKDRLVKVGTALTDLRTQAKMVKESLAGAADFRVRGEEALEKLHGQLAKVREAGSATDATLDKLSLTFEANSRGARTYIQALDKIASDKGASDSVRQLAKALSDEAREANYDVTALEKRGRALDQMISKQGRTFASLRRQLEPPAPAEGKPDGGGGGHGAVPQQAAASAAARLAEGTVSIRAAERFLTSTLSLGPALQAIFPIVGGLAFLDLLGGLVDRAEQLYETFKKLQEEPALIAQEFRSLNNSLKTSNDELDLTNAKLANEIAKLTGKPQNGLLEALAEARVAADKLADSLDKDLESLQKLLSEHQVGFFKSLLLAQAQTKDLAKEFGGGESGFLATGFPGQIQKITGAAQEQLTAIKPGTTEDEKRGATDQKNAINAKTRNDLEKAYAAEIAKVNGELAKAQKLQSEHDNPKPTQTVAVISGVPIQAAGASPILDQTRRIAQLQGIRHQLILEQHSAQAQFQNEALTEQIKPLQHQNEAARANPFGEKMNELAAQIEAARSALDAVGKSDTAEVLAKSWGKAQESIARLNNELARHRQSLTLEQQVSILTEQDTLALTEAEVAWKTKLDQTTDSITNRIVSLRLMTEAIGKGAAATRQAAIESQVMQTLGPKYADEQFLNQKDPVTGETHRAQVQSLRQQFGAEYDTQRLQQSTQNVEKLTDQISLEKSLALVQARGAEAVRLQTLAYQLRNMVMAGATPKEIQAQFDLAEAQRKNQSAGNVANLDQQIDSTRRLSAAQLQGAEEYRQTQLQLKYEQMQRSGSSTEEITKTKTVDTLQHQQQVTEQALQTAMSYRNQLQSVNEQITAVEQLRSQWGNTRDIEISLKTLEEQRTQVLSQQALAVGSAKDGIAAFFREMATNAESSAQMVHDAFASAFNGINDQLSRLMTGQKTSWASFLQSLGAQISKMGLMGLEHTIAAKITGKLGQAQQQAGGAGSSSPVGHGIAGVLGKIFGADTLKRDGNTPATALFVTMTGANGIPMWSAGGTANMAMPDFGITSSDLNQLEYGGEGGSTSAVVETLANGAAKSTPGIGGEILGAAAKVAEAFINHLHSSKSESSSSSSSSTTSSGSSAGGSSAPGAQQGDTLTRDPSGLIIRTPAPTSSNQRSMQTLENGARPKPSVWGEIGKASLQLFQAWLAHTSSSGGDSGSDDGGGGEEVDSSITYHAKGGRPRVGKVSVVGEKGPELFVPDTAGTIIPNHKLSAAFTGGSRPGKNSMDALSAALGDQNFGGFRATGGSVDPNNAYVVGEAGPEAFASMSSPGKDGADPRPYQIVQYSIDARGTDPYLTEQRTRAAIVAAHQSAIVTSVQTSGERSKRVPQR